MIKVVDKLVNRVNSDLESKCVFESAAIKYIKENDRFEFYALVFVGRNTERSFNRDLLGFDGDAVYPEMTVIEFEKVVDSFTASIKEAIGDIAMSYGCE